MIACPDSHAHSNSPPPNFPASEQMQLYLLRQNWQKKTQTQSGCFCPCSWRLIASKHTVHTTWLFFFTCLAKSGGKQVFQAPNTNMKSLTSKALCAAVRKKISSLCLNNNEIVREKQQKPQSSQVGPTVCLLPF